MDGVSNDSWWRRQPTYVHVLIIIAVVLAVLLLVSVIAFVVLPNILISNATRMITDSISGAVAQQTTGGGTTGTGGTA